VDEKTAIQALDRLDPLLPLSPARLERHGFEYRRNGTLSLYAALDVKTEKVRGKTAERHTSAEFVGFLEQIISGSKLNQEIHIILDNLSAHKTNQVEQFLRNADVNLHFTPTYSSWLNQVEIWFARLEREVIAGGIFTSVQDLSRKLMRYIRAYSKTARPFKWKYSDEFAAESSHANEFAATGHFCCVFVFSKSLQFLYSHSVIHNGLVSDGVFFTSAQSSIQVLRSLKHFSLVCLVAALPPYA
jgi:transposase